MKTGVYETSRDDGRWTDIRDVQDWKCGAHQAQQAIKRPCHVFFSPEGVFGHKILSLMKRSSSQGCRSDVE